MTGRINLRRPGFRLGPYFGVKGGGVALAQGGGVYGAGTPAGIYLGNSEAAGLAIDFTADSALVRWPGGTQYSGNTAGLLSVVRASVATYFDINGVLQTASNNVLRLDYDPVSLVALGALIEEQRTNLLFYSSDYTASGSWSKANVSVVSNAVVAPDGTPTAQTIVENSTTNVHRIIQSISPGSLPSIYAKYAGRRYMALYANGTSIGGPLAIVDLQNGIVTQSTGTVGIISVGNGWWRVWISDPSVALFVVSLANVGTYTPAGYGSVSYLGDGVSGISLWGAQVEAGAFPTSYIPTTSSQVTRAADQSSLATSKFPWNPALWSIAVKFQTISPSISTSSGRVLGANASSRAFANIANTTGLLNLLDGTSAPKLGDLVLASMNAAAFTVTGGNARASLNGGGVLANASAGSFAAISALDFGFDGTGGGNQGNLHLSRMLLVPRIFSDAELVTRAQ